jgi:hypothetical protein
MGGRKYTSNECPNTRQLHVNRTIYDSDIIVRNTYKTIVVHEVGLRGGSAASHSIAAKLVTAFVHSNTLVPLSLMGSCRHASSLSSPQVFFVSLSKLTFFITISNCLAPSFASNGTKSCGMGLLILKPEAHCFISLTSPALVACLSNSSVLTGFDVRVVASDMSWFMVSMIG